MIGTEILTRNMKLASLGLGSYETKDPPNVKDLATLTEQASSWPDKLIELEIWTSLAYVSSRTGLTENLKYCHSKALECLSYFEKKKSDNM
jgi:HEPN domain-containing protein